VSELRGGHLHVDCVSGAAGDMVLGALFDLGVPVAVVSEAIDALGFGDRLSVHKIVKRGVSAIDVKVQGEGESETGHSHRHYSEIRKLIEGAGLDEAVSKLAFDIFDRVARAEAKLHGTTIDDVAFHEVGAVDSIVDIVGAAAALAWLAPVSVSCPAVAMGHGSLECGHGVLPVPAPASLEIMRESGGIMVDGGVARELCTPTGAAILSAIVTRWGPMPSMSSIAVGYGAGDADLPDRANVLRITAGRAPATDDVMVRIEANVDDMNPEICENAAEALFEAGAVDVWWTPITMKKARPALQLSALAPEARVDDVARAVLRETTSIGVRFDRVSRRVLDREVVSVDTRFGPISIKIARLEGEVVNAAPEYEDCRAAAGEHGVPLKVVYAAAIAAYEPSRAT
jgi:uncharacterized protein (TIGR00299 family) protein